MPRRSKRARIADMVEREQEEALEQLEKDTVYGTVAKMPYTVASLIGDLRMLPETLPIFIHVERKVPHNETIDITFVCEHHRGVDILLQEGEVWITNFRNE